MLMKFFHLTLQNNCYFRHLAEKASCLKEKELTIIDIPYSMFNSMRKVLSMKGRDKKRKKKREILKELKKKLPGWQKIPGRNPVSSNFKTIA